MLAGKSGREYGKKNINVSKYEAWKYEKQEINPKMEQYKVRIRGYMVP